MRFLKWFLIVLAVLLLLVVFVGMPYMREQTKKHSPQKTATYSQNGLNLSVKYSSPFKKGRIVFGNLVPYNEVWRTGANEPTSFTTATDIRVIDKSLPAGAYSLWTIPEKEQWTIIFNKNIPDWGVTLLSGGKETSREPSQDIVQVKVPTEVLEVPQENFLIAFEHIAQDQCYLSLSWDNTKVKVPINP